MATAAAKPKPIVRFYSPSSAGFYSSEVHGKAIPKDARSISEEMYQALLASQANGQQIVADERGNPTTVAPIIDERTKAAQLENRRAQELASTDSLLIAHMMSERTLTSAQLASVIGYRKALRGSGGLPSKPDFLR